jgi:hypothetical protein
MSRPPINSTVATHQLNGNQPFSCGYTMSFTSVSSRKSKPFSGLFCTGDEHHSTAG